MGRHNIGSTKWETLCFVVIYTVFNVYDDCGLSTTFDYCCALTSATPHFICFALN